MFVEVDAVNKRLEWVDSLKGILMVLVLWGHFFPPERIGVWIYSFHMPAFFIISGYLKKNRTFVESCLKKAKGLLVPYGITALASFILGIFLYRGMGLEVSLKEMLLNMFYLNGSVGWNSPIWFLIVLFELDIFFSLVNRRLHQILVFFSFLLIGYLLYRNRIILPFGIHVFVWASVFYAFGQLIKTNNFELSKNKFIIWVVFILGMLLNCFFIGFQYEVTSMYLSQLGVYWIFFVNGLLTSYVIIMMFKHLRINIKFLNLISKYSLQIMCTHYLFYMFYRILDKLFFNHYLLSYQLIPSMINTAFCIIAYIIIYKTINKPSKR